MSSKPFTLAPISVGLSTLAPGSAFDVIVIGSGYGGSIAAARLASPDRTVCLLERGCEILPGSYPTDMASAHANTQIVTARDGRLDPAANGMMELRVGDDVHVVLGCGLGGGSLVNASVSIEPDMRVFDAGGGWPAAYRPVPIDPAKPDGARKNILTPHFATVRSELGATTLPTSITLPKLEALRQSASAMKQPLELADINVTFEAGTNWAGVQQAACTLCGDCCSGCNYGAKNTLLMNYLPYARKQGAVLVTQAEVLTIAKAGPGWIVNVCDRSKGAAQGPGIVLKATTVILAAGALGSTEILWRSREANGLALSDCLGRRFSGNGDVLGFGFGANTAGYTGSAFSEPVDPKNPGGPQKPTLPPVYSIGAGTNAPTAPQFQPGPCITGIIRVSMTDKDPLGLGMVIEDGAPPGPMAAVYPAMMFLGDALDADFTDFPDSVTRLQSLADLGLALQTTTDPAALSYTGVMARLQSYLVMSHDDSGGTLAYAAPDGTEPGLFPGFVHVHWPDAGKGAPFTRDNGRLRAAAEGIWANYVANPIWSPAFGHNLVTVHPVGGCAMADRAEDGVTDGLCRVFSGKSGSAVYPNLLVCDGGVLPTSLGVNPLLTISAVADYAVTALIARAGATLTGASGCPAPVPGPVRAPAKVAGAASDWRTRTWEGLATVEVAMAACETAAKSKSPVAGITLALTGLFDGLLPADDQQPMQDLMNKDLLLGDADYAGDMATAFATLAADFGRLAGIANPDVPAGQQPSPQWFQDLMAAIVDIFGDVSPQVAFAESMRGWVSDAPAKMDHALSDAYAIAEATGRADGTTMVADFAVTAATTLGRDADGSVSAQIVDAALGGTVTIAWNGGAPVSYPVTDGRFTLLQPDPDRVECWLMTYTCDLGTDWRMKGVKTLMRRPGSSWGGELTTLAVDLEAIGATGRAGQKGLIRLDLQAIAKQTSTITTGFPTDLTRATFGQALAAKVSAHALSTSLSGADGLLHKALRVALAANDAPGADGWPASLTADLKQYFVAGIAALFGRLVLRAYGGLPSYLNDFPAQGQTAYSAIPNPQGGSVDGVACKTYDLNPPGRLGPVRIRLYNFCPPGAKRGPVILSPGMSTTALSFAATTVKTNIVQLLLAQGYDVWLFDNRMSPQILPAQVGYTLDDIAREDWPAAVNAVLQMTGKSSVQVLAHCVGGLTAQMALLSGAITPAQVRQLVLSQFTVHVAANWYNAMTNDIGLAQGVVNGLPAAVQGLIAPHLPTGPAGSAIARLMQGVPAISTVSGQDDPGMFGGPAGAAAVNQFLNMVVWNAPTGIDRPCLSPTCHRIFGMFGPSFAHANLNEATHDGIREFFGTIATKPFEQLGLLMLRGHAVDAQGADVYLPNWKNLDLPIHMISGMVNQILLPDGSFRTWSWLREKMPAKSARFTRTTIESYAHMDCFIGKNAAQDVFPGLLAALAPYGDG